MASRIKFYLDEHVQRVIQEALAAAGFEAIMAVDVQMTAKDDDTEHLPYATEQNTVLFTRDKAFAGRTQKRTDHAGLVCWTGKQDDIGGMVRALTQFASEYVPEDVRGQVFWLK